MGMKIIRDLKVTEDEFFDYLEDAFCRELEQASGKHVHCSQLKPGFTYVSKDKASSIRTTVEVVAYERGKHYETLTTSPSDTTRIYYEVEPSEKPGCIHVVFCQETDSFERRRRTPLKVFSEAVYLGRMAESLFNIQDTLIECRKIEEGNS